MLVVIRCPSCREASRVEESDLGQTVQCPQCADPFAAIEEAELITNAPRSLFPRDIANGTGAPTAGPATDPRLRRQRRRLFEPPAANDTPQADTPSAPAADPNAPFDTLGEPHGSLPASVVVGLALLPFLIPIFWLITPALIGQEPVVSLGSALALAVSASVLCLAVIYTVDWRPGTRVKGVILLVILSYIAGVGLYLIKKDVVDRVRRFFGIELPWVEFHPPQAAYKVKLPVQPQPVADRPMTLVVVSCHEANHANRFGFSRYVVGSSMTNPRGPRGAPAIGVDAWFTAAEADITREARVTKPVRSERIKHQDVFPGLQLELTLPDDNIRIVRIYVVRNRVYYLAVEGPALAPDDDHVEQFFDSFEVVDGAN
jgi:hypothetical protein